MVKRKLNIKRVFLVLILLILIAITALAGVFFYELSPVDKNGEKQDYTVESGTLVNEIFADLESKGLIKSALFMKIYNKISGGLDVKAGTYKISSSMDATDIYKILGGEVIDNAETFTLTFKEGGNIRGLINTLEEKTKIKKVDIVTKLKDETYLNELIEDYWFITEDIKQADIKYSLEGYLFPDTYTFYTNATIEDIFRKMLNTMEDKLEPYKDQIETSKYSAHEILTLASIVELESADPGDRKKISSVFNNRLKDDWGSSIGSCVTTYYAFDINMGDRDLSLSEISDCSGKYNTRCVSFMGLPIGPVGNPGIDSIEATLNPDTTDYTFFVSDTTGKTHFTKSNAEHEAKIDELERLGLWYAY